MTRGKSMRDLAAELGEAASRVEEAITAGAWERAEAPAQLAASRAATILTRVRVMVDLGRENA